MHLLPRLLSAIIECMDINQSVFEQKLAELSAELKRRGIHLVTAESCTGGGVAQACTALPGSSDWFEGGFVTYSNTAKSSMLGVPAEMIDAHGAVSDSVARRMAEGALQRSEAGAALSITGVAGPGGGSIEKPVGTVCFAWAANGLTTKSERLVFVGDRASVREQAVLHSLQGLLAVLKGHK